MNKKYLTYTIILAAIGLILSVILAKIDIDALHNPVANSFCTINESFNCVKVARSEFASQFGIPNFIFGIILYLGIIVFTSIARLSTKKILPNIMTYIFWISLNSVIFSIYLFYMSLTVIKSFCIFCAGVYVVNLLIFLVSFMSESFSIKKLFSSLVEDLKIFFKSGLRAGIFFACIIFGVIGLSYFNAHPVLGDPAKNNNSDLPKIDFSKSSFDRLATGPSGAPEITILLFTDFECPFCGHASVEIHKLLQKNPDIRLVFKDYPLDQSCNYTITRPLHKYACKASICARCAAEQGKFWEYHDLIYSNQGAIEENKIFEEFAEQLGLDLNKFNECVKSKKPFDKIITDIDEARALNVEGTPTLFIRGKKIEGFRTVEELQKIVDDVRQEIAKEKEEEEKERQEYEKRQREALQN